MARLITVGKQGITGRRPLTLSTSLPLRTQVAMLLGRWVSCENTEEEIRSNPTVKRLVREGVVLCGSGPSLRRVDVREPGLPIAAVSTAIRSDQLRRPEVWFLADPPNENHGPSGRALWDDPEVLKLAPSFCTTWRPGRNVLRPAVNLRKQEKAALAAGRQAFDGRLPLMRRPNKTITFALQCLVYFGVTQIILCGCDLSAGPEPESHYGHDRTLDRQALRSHVRMLDATRMFLAQWLPHMAALGVDVRSWSPGSMIEQWIGKYEPAHAPPAGSRKESLIAR